MTFTITTEEQLIRNQSLWTCRKVRLCHEWRLQWRLGGYVSMYTINPTTGALASIGPPVSTYDYGVYPGSVTVDPSGKFVYVTNAGDPGVLD